MDTNRPSTESAALRTLQLTIAALFFGSLVFGVIAFFLGPVGQQPPPAPPASGQAAAGGMPMPALLRLVWGALAAGELLMFPIVRRANLKLLVEEPATDEQADRESLIQSFRQLSIIAGALAEGLALFGGVILLLTGNPMDALLVALPLLALAVMFPTAAKQQAFVQRIHNERALRPV
jgi:hypothetical protein